jgi:S-adenosylmethionine-dependent methyltransferase
VGERRDSAGGEASIGHYQSRKEGSPPVSEIVRDFYDVNVEREWSRLDEPLGKIEFASTLRLVDKHFPGSGRACDIGGGPGRYSVALAQRGYRVTLVDLSHGLLERAKVALTSEGVSVERLLQADARDLGELPSNHFDAGLLLGPLYHLVERPKRLMALAELRRVLTASGVGIVAYLNSWGILRCGVGDFPERYADLAFMQSLLGETAYPGGVPGFTECYWSTPEAAFREIREAGLEPVDYCGAEGLAGGMRPMVERMASDHPHGFANLLEVAAATSELPQYRDATEHLHIVVRKSCG